MIALLLACTSPFADFDASVEAFLEQEGLPGATAVIVHRDDGVVHTQAYGTFQVDRVSLIASSSKVMSAGVLMALHDRGVLDVDAPVSDALAGWGAHKTDINTAQLLSNSSGMVGLTDDPMYTKYLCQYLPDGTLSDCAETIYTADDAADRVPPDTAFRYGGGPWQLAGGVAEQASGMTWDELVDDVYGPCELQSTGYTNVFLKALAEADDDVLTPYPSFFQGDPANLDPTDNPNLEGGGYTTVGDYEKLLLMHLNGGECPGGQVLSAASVDRMQQDRIGDVWGGSSFWDDFPGYGLGWFVSRQDAVVYDGGAYGATPWLDLDRGYGAMIILEAHHTQGAALFEQVQPELNAVFDAW